MRGGLAALKFNTSTAANMQKAFSSETDKASEEIF